MTKIRLFLVALVAALLVPVLPVHAGGVPISPSVSSCSAPVLSFFDDRVCIDPTVGSTRRIYIYTNNVLVSWFPLAMQTGLGCTGFTPMSAAWFPIQVTPVPPGGTKLGAQGVMPNGTNLTVDIADFSWTSCGGGSANWHINDYRASTAAIAAIIAVSGTHTLVHVI
jgi:hypothetical protein